MSNSEGSFSGKRKKFSTFSVFKTTVFYYQVTKIQSKTRRTVLLEPIQKRERFRIQEVK